MKKNLINVFLTIFLSILPKATPQIKTEIVDFLDTLEEKAKATANPIDDIVVAMLKGIVGE